MAHRSSHTGGFVPSLDSFAELRSTLTAQDLTRGLVDIPRWLLLATLVFAPWAYGSTQPWAIQTLNLLLGLTCLLWLAECAARRRWPQVPLFPAIVTGLLLLHGWGMALNAHHYFDPPSGGLLPKAAWLPGLPGSADRPLSISTMQILTGLLGVLLLSSELAQRPDWRKRIWLTMALTGFSMALFGITQKIGGEAMLALLWEPEKRDLANNFGTFRYRGNAGAWLNLTLPLLAGLTFVSFQKPRRPWSKTFWLMTLFVLLAGVQLNPSRASWVIALGIGAVVGGRIAWHQWRRRAEAVQTRELMVYGTIGALILVAIGLIAFWGGWETSWSRLDRQGIDLAARSPTEIYLRMIPDAGLTGYGPGTFQSVFPAYQMTHDFGGRAYPEFWVTDRWIHAHQDYLQTLIEWGYVGMTFWATLFFGGVVRGAIQYWRVRKEFSLRWLLFCSALAIVGVLLHALIDFPLQVASIQLYVAVLLGTCWGARGENGRGEGEGWMQSEGLLEISRR